MTPTVLTPITSRLKPARARLVAARARVLTVVVLLVAASRRGAPDLFTLTGGLLIAVGAGLIAVPAGLIVGGAFLALFGITLDLARARSTGGNA